MRSIRTAIITGVATVSLVAGGFTAVADDTATTPATETTTGSSVNKKDDDTNKTGGSSFGKKEEGGVVNGDKPAKDRPTDTEADVECEGSVADMDKFDNKDNDCNTRPLSTDLKDKNNSSNSSVWGKRYQAEKDVTGYDLLGQVVNFGDQPVWSQIWLVTTILGVVGSAVGLIALPILNEAKARGIII